MHAGKKMKLNCLPTTTGLAATSANPPAAKHIWAAWLARFPSRVSNHPRHQRDWECLYRQAYERPATIARDLLLPRFPSPA